MPFNTETHQRDRVELPLDENVEMSLSHGISLPLYTFCRDVFKTHYNYF